MTDIIKLAKEAGFQIATGLNGKHWPHCEGYDLEAELERFAELVAAPLKAENEAAQSAVKTLEQLGYTYHGGELWKPPLGKAPDFNLIDLYRADAERYRWLRENCAFETEAWLSHCTPQDYDKAIDAARAKEQTP